MRTHLRLLAPTLALTPLLAHAQDAVLVLSPSATTTVKAGTGTPGFAGDGAASAFARLASPAALAQDVAGNTYIADTRNHRIRRIAADGTITTIAGNGTQGFAGDEGPATDAQLDSPAGLAIAADGTLYIADTRNHRIRRIDLQGVIHTCAGVGGAGFGGDGAAATLAQFSFPQGLAIGLAGDLYIADTGNHRVRHIAANGTIATVAGDGEQGVSTAQSATAVHLDSPTAVAVRTDGSVLIADRRNSRVLVLATNGTLKPLDTASLNLRHPIGVAVDSSGDTLIADSGNYRVARVTAKGSGVAFGSSEQGAVDTSKSPLQTPFGAPAAALTATSAAVDVVDLTALDRDHGQMIQVSLARLAFPDTRLASQSTSRAVRLTNAGTSVIVVQNIDLSSAFRTTATSTCGSTPFTLAAGSSCTLDLVFAPQAVGNTESLLQVYSAAGAPQRIIVAGTGVSPSATLASSTSLQVSGSIVYAGSPLTLSALVLGSATSAPSGSVNFADGLSQLGQATLNSSAQATLSTSSLQTGIHSLTARFAGDSVYQPSTSAPVQVTIVASPDFTLATSGGSRVTVQRGSAGTMALLLQPINGVLNQTVSMKVDGFPPNTTINVTPVPVTLGSDPTVVSVAFKLPVSLSLANRPAVLASLLPCLLFLRRRKPAMLLCVAFGCCTLLHGCGGGYLSGNSSTAAQSTSATYPITVTATCTGVTGQPLTHTATFTVVVQ